MPHQLLRYFQSGHLPPQLADIADECTVLAQEMDAQLPDCAEKTAGLRKLLEAKDCFVRAALDQLPSMEDSVITVDSAGVASTAE